MNRASSLFRTTAFIWTIFGLLEASSGQSDDMLTARTIKNTLMVDIDERSKNLRLIGNRSDVDEVKWEFATKESEPYILVTDNTYNLQLRTINPLKYSVIVDGRTFEDDPYEKTLLELAANFQSLLGIISRGSLTTGSLNSGDEFRSGRGVEVVDPSQFIRNKIELTTQPEIDGRGRMGAAVSEVEEVRDYEIRRSIMLLDQMSGTGFGDIEANDALVKVVVDSVLAIEKNANVDMIQQATSVVQTLVHVDLSSKSAESSIDDLQTLIKKMRKHNVRLVEMVRSLSHLDGEIAKVAGSLRKVRDEEIKIRMAQVKDKTWFKAEVKRLKKDGWDDDEAQRIAAGGGDPAMFEYMSYQTRQVRQFVILALEEFSDRMLEFAQQRQVLISNLTELMSLMTDAQSKASTTTHGTELLHQESIPKGKAEVVTIKIKKRSFEVKGNYSVVMEESDFFAQKLKFMRAHTFYPQVFPGLVFVNSSFDEFTAEEDSTGVMRVSSETSKPGYFNAAGMVNFNFKLGRREEVPFLQIGVSAKRARPQFFVGAGIRFTDWFAISTGAAMHWQASLDKLAIGDRVSSQDNLEKDLRYQLGRPQLYFGVQLRPSALTKKP
ncbi:MAG: hypothetical protein JNM62_05365 [Flavobacteriales bacterium]|nr:hypothetical protein [Flavobacteriales bacterium]